MSEVRDWGKVTNVDSILLWTYYHMGVHDNDI